MKYPIYIPSKGRAKHLRTAKMLNDIQFLICVEPQEYDQYAAVFGEGNLIALPENDRGIAYSRTFIKSHARESGAERHWQMDDDFTSLRVLDYGKSYKKDPREVLTAVEDFTDRYTNIGITGLKHSGYAFSSKTPISINRMVYGCILFDNSLPYEWRGLGEDTDMSLQVLSGGFCTVLFNVYSFETVSTGINEGGNDFRGDGRVKRVRELQRRWPRLVKIRSSYGRPQHNLDQIWRKFDHKLIKK